MSEIAKTRILVTNIVTLNVGDAAILYGMIDALKNKYGENIEIIVLDRYAGAAKKYFPEINFLLPLYNNGPRTPIGRKIKSKGYWHWVNRARYYKYIVALFLLEHLGGLLARILCTDEELKTLSAYLNTNLHVSTGGTYLIEKYNLDTAIKGYMLSIRLSRKLIFFTQSLGPFSKKKNIQAFSRIFGQADVVLVRDVRSKFHLNEIGVNLNVRKHQDAAFLLKNESIRMKKKRLAAGKKLPASVAISVRSMRNFYSESEDGYVKIISDIVVYLVVKFGVRVKFVSTCQGIPEYWADDSQVARQIVKLLPSDIAASVQIDDKFRSPKELVEEFASHKFVIATRMHAAILSVCSGTPVIGLAYEFKSIELFVNLDMPELCVDLDGFDAGEIIDSVSRLFADFEKYEQKFLSKSRDMYHEAGSVIGSLPSLDSSQSIHG